MWSQHTHTNKQRLAATKTETKVVLYNTKHVHNHIWSKDPALVKGSQWTELLQAAQVMDVYSSIGTQLLAS